MPNAADFRQLAELPLANPLPVLLCDGESRVLYRNPAATKFPNRFPAGVDRIEQTLPADFTETIQRVLESGEALKDQLWEVHGRTLSVTYQPLENKREVFVVIVDETERVQAAQEAQAYAAEFEEAYRSLQDAQTQLIQSAKMAALGSLVSGIAHELNSPLGALVANNDTHLRCLARIAAALKKTEPEPPSRHLREAVRLTDILQGLQAANGAGLERISTLVESLRSFARLDRAQRDDVNLHEGLDSTVTLLAPELKRGIEVRRQYRLEERVRCAPGQINQVFMNLLLNAVQAIPTVGVIDIRTDSRDGFAVVDIEDNGEGVREEHLDRIFDPGFTTRGVGIGKGLGLPVAYQVVQAHGGSIEVSRPPDGGSRFRVILPIQPEPDNTSDSA